jgi:hypothetical protein
VTFILVLAVGAWAADRLLAVWLLRRSTRQLGDRLEEIVRGAPAAEPITDRQRDWMSRELCAMCCARFDTSQAVAEFGPIGGVR